MWVGVGRYKQNKQTKIFRGSLASSFLEALVSGARPMEIVASSEERLERVRVLPLSVVGS